LSGNFPVADRTAGDIIVTVGSFYNPNPPDFRLDCRFGQVSDTPDELHEMGKHNEA